ncbi:MAG: outer membrane protein assembly factor BamB family protein, partial [Amnibacterium sp.]
MRIPSPLAAAAVQIAALPLAACSTTSPAPARATGATMWTADLGGAVVGHPVVDDDRIIAATERDRVVALDPADGSVLWSRTVGEPLTGTASVVGCGNLDPLGITSAPVVDPATDTVYVVAEVRTGPSAIEHRLVGLDIRTGRVVRELRADPPLPDGESALQLLQRPALVLANGRVYAAYGGNSGDCGRYHGWVVGLDVRGDAPPVSFEVAADGEGGAIWMSGGAPAVDASGNLYVTTGNADPVPPQGGPDPKRFTESVVKLSPALVPLASFKDRIAGGDEDLSTGPPVLLPDGRVFAVGKTDVASLLDRADLHRVASIEHVCGSDPDGTPAYDGAAHRMLVPCRGGGIQVVDLAAMRLG